MRLRYPAVYSHNAASGTVPFQHDSGWTGWVAASTGVTIHEVANTIGLDAALLLKFTHLCTKILAVIGMPMIFLALPLLLYLSKASAGLNLSSFDTMHYSDGSGSYWIIAFLVWFVLVVTQWMIFAAQREFIALRIEWLQKMSAPRATTVLVENIPVLYYSDEKLASYVDSLLSRQVVESTYVIRKTGALADKVMRLRSMWASLEGADDAHGSEIMDMEQVVKQEIDEVEVAVKEQRPTVFARAGFVTFRQRRDMELFLNLIFSPPSEEEHEPVLSAAPEPSDIIFDNLQCDPRHDTHKMLMGYLSIALVFLFYCPAVIFISLTTNLDALQHFVPSVGVWAVKYPMLAAFFDGVMSSFVLSLLMSLVPTILMLIIRHFFVMKAETLCQYSLQHWYFLFKVHFELFLFALGRSLFTTYASLVRNPTHVFVLLASTLPRTSHFYLYYIPLQWVAYAVDCLRLANLFKFLYYQRSFTEDRARELAEPEDQDYSGIGARTARFTTLFVISLVFCTISPLICVVGILNFAICRLLYGYLLVFTEDRKPDQGGIFWVRQLNHVQQGIFLYITLMVGILWQRSASAGPSLVAGLGYVYMWASYRKFRNRFHWERLSFEDIVHCDAIAPLSATLTCKASYVQPELIKDES